MAQELCRCQSGTHGHEPGKCPNPATENDGLCKRCHDEALAGATKEKITLRERDHTSAGAHARA
jgi:hypothetical protein